MAASAATSVTAVSTRVSKLCALLNAVEARYVIVGATALQLWGSSRSTRELDIPIKPTVQNADRVLAALSQLPFGVARDLTANDIFSRSVIMIGDTPNVDVLKSPKFVVAVAASCSSPARAQEGCDERLRREGPLSGARARDDDECHHGQTADRVQRSHSLPWRLLMISACTPADQVVVQLLYCRSGAAVT